MELKRKQKTHMYHCKMLNDTPLIDRLANRKYANIMNANMRTIEPNVVKRKSPHH